MRYLGIDYGKKRVGIALSDEKGEFALAHSVLPNGAGEEIEAALVDEVIALCKKNAVSEIVIGESLDFKQKPNAIMTQIKAFTEALQKKSGMPVHFEPEFFTSAEAEHIQGKTEKHDASAAALILKSYLDRGPERKKDAPAPVSKDAAPKTAPEKKPMITFDDFSKIEVTVGKIVSAEKVPDTDKLLKLMVDFGEEKPRQIISGISKYFPNEKDELVGRKCMFITNLEPRTIKGYESNGMLFALSTPEGQFSLLTPTPDIPQGTKAK